MTVGCHASPEGTRKEAPAKLQARFFRAREMIRVRARPDRLGSGEAGGCDRGQRRCPGRDSNADGRARLIHDRLRQAEPCGAVVSVVQRIRRYGEGP